MGSKLVTTAEAAKIIGISRQSLQAWIAAGVDAPEMIGGNVRLWSPADIAKLKRVKVRRDKKFNR